MKLNRNQNKANYQHLDIPDETEYSNLLDSLFVQGDDAGLGDFDPTRRYAQGECALIDGKLYQATQIIEPASTVNLSQWRLVSFEGNRYSEYAAYDNGAYTIGQRVTYNYRLWECVLDVEPYNEPASESIYWLEVSANSALLADYVPQLYKGQDIAVWQKGIIRAFGSKYTTIDCTNDFVPDPAKWDYISSFPFYFDGQLKRNTGMTASGAATIDASGILHVPSPQISLDLQALSDLIRDEDLEPSQDYYINDADVYVTARTTDELFPFAQNSSGAVGVFDPVSGFATYSVNATASITGGGSLLTNSLRLVNDVASPTASSFYGTDTAGNKGWFTFSSAFVIPINRNQLAQLRPQSDSQFLDPPDNTEPDPSYVPPGTLIANVPWQFYEIADYEDPNYPRADYTTRGGLPRLIVQQLPENNYDEPIYDDDGNQIGSTPISTWADVIPAYLRGALWDGDERPTGWYYVNTNTYKSLEYKIGESLTPIYSYVDSAVNQPRDRWVKQLKDNSIIKISHISPQPAGTVFSDSVYFATNSYSDRLWRVQGLARNYGPGTASFVFSSTVYNASSGAYQYGVSENPVLIPPSTNIEFDVMPNLFRYRIGGTSSWVDKEGSEALTPTQTTNDSVFVSMTVYLNSSNSGGTYSNIKYYHLAKTYMGYTPRDYNGTT